MNKNIGTESIKYMGSKTKILPYIYEEIINLKLNLNNINILDGFAGSTRVSQMFSKMGMKVTSNDITDYSYILGNCYLNNHNKKEIEDIISYLNSLEPKKGWFYNNYSILEKKPFQDKNLMKLDSIRDEIDKLNLSFNSKAVVLTSLILALDKVDNTLGHFTSYLKNFSKRSYNDLELKTPKLFHNKKDNIILKQNILETIKNNYDIVYLDPPYGTSSKIKSSRVRYNAYYHIWNTIIKNDKPNLFGKAGRREDSRDKFVSNFEITNDEKLKNNFIELINNIQSKYIILSYNSAGSISINEFKNILNNKGDIINVKQIDYKSNVMANMNWSKEFTNEKQENYKEYLITIKVK